MVIEFFLFFCVITLSAFFSSSETALFSLSRTTLNRWQYQGSFLQRKVVNLMQFQSALLITILLANTFVNVYLTILGENIKDHLFYRNFFLADLLAPVIITAVLLFFGEIIPKAFALKNSESITPFYIVPLQLLFYLLRPFSYLLEKLMNLKEDGETKVSVEELSTFVKIAAEEKIFNENEVTILQNIFELRQLYITNCLTPRKKLVTASPKATYSNVSSLISKYSYSRLPVINDDNHQLIGILIVKRFKTLPQSLQNKWVSLAIEKPYFIPEQATLNKATRKFSQERISMLIVVDEYGGIAGLLTYQDIVERVIGEVPDEYKSIPNAFIKKKENHWHLEGLVEFQQIYREFNIKFSYNGPAQTINGYLLEVLRRLPQKGDVATLDKYQFKVEETLNACVVKVIMTKVGN